MIEPCIANGCERGGYHSCGGYCREHFARLLQPQRLAAYDRAGCRDVLAAMRRDVAERTAESERSRTPEPEPDPPQVLGPPYPKPRRRYRRRHIEPDLTAPPGSRAFAAAMRAYRATPGWVDRRERLVYAHPLCAACGVDDRPLQLHHVTYERAGHEDDADLVVLCWPCHRRVHGIAMGGVSLVESTARVVGQ